MEEKRVRSKSEEKRSQIIDAAGALFITDGFEKVSMEQIAKSAGVSKQTVYSHFGNKQLLFTAAIDCKCEEYDLAPNKIKQPMGCEEYLSLFSQQLSSLLISEDAIGMFRACISGAGQSEVSKLFWEAGPGKIRRQLRVYLEEQSKLGILCIENIDTAAAQLMSMIVCETQFQSLIGLPQSKSTEELKQYATQCAQLFYKAYRC
ncbi:TetR/AcrR family transcriptional regulator [Zhongshania aliphaticivorans]|uniref:TetR/AcrR family transcriptional regulator n=1 Tax=Zhongshania aliphaticivorans TaxID=1470434 RepID=UPI0013302F4C|nr:TetR/AcrR family transcriptional regulator [Zhongshania aliphaticivorans]